jgi:hypothetical protein
MLEGTLNTQIKAPAAKDIPAQVTTDTDLPAQDNRWRSFWATPAMMHYNRLIILVVLVNLVILYNGITQGWWQSNGVALTTISNLVIVNFSLTIIVRQQYVINLLFKIATSVPRHWPLSIRRVMGKVYHFGGLHVGGVIAGMAWFVIFTGSLTYHRIKGLPGVSVTTLAVTYALLGLLLLIGMMARPSQRARYHDRFEKSHRFGGWAALALFWAQTLLFVNDQRGELDFGDALVASPGFWLLLLVTVSIILPWLRLKKVAVQIENPSPHVALVQFDYGVTPFAGSSTTVSRSPLLEWHSFANVPAPGENGFRLTISRAGDWTGQFIDDLPSHVWVKGIPTAGVGNIDKLFNRVVWIATGSGIGPTLPHLLNQLTPARLVWSTRTPRETYGDKLVNEILAVEPEALIWDTNEHGRPDLVQLAYQAYKDFDAEAVICISNKKLTWQVVHGMESRGIPAYGAIWDS